MMVANTIAPAQETIDLRKEEMIAAPIEVTFEAVLEELGPGGQMPDGTPLRTKLEPWPGGRWYRDLGDDSGHLWGHVQVIKPPTLLEIRGPLFMSYPALNFIQYRLTAEGDHTRLQFTHQALGQIPREHREGVVHGWEHCMRRIREIAGRRGKVRA